MILSDATEEKRSIGKNKRPELALSKQLTLLENKLNIIVCQEQREAVRKRN